MVTGVRGVGANRQRGVREALLAGGAREGQLWVRIRVRAEYAPPAL